MSENIAVTHPAVEGYLPAPFAICRLGGARLDRITTECRKSQSTVSRTIKELDTDYRIRRGKNIWYPTSAVAKKVSQSAKPGQALRPDTQKPRGSGAVDQDADLLVVIGEAA